ncbi:Uncharacterized protein TCM_038568 [Theobroma cacao]|uniref:DUF4283 domain-containing protein n=1 Tax=Theobroma cacao TaxID=3641 RepID=A0A061GPZ7_THECC|nr:Uncharacterized protein TCM_038568 [Theobroma cacao]
MLGMLRGSQIEIKLKVTGVKSIRKQMEVKLEEIPLHVWHENGFKAIGDMWGRFINAEKDTMESWRLDQALICVKVKSLKHITTNTHLKVNGRDYFIRATIVDVVKSEPRVRVSNFGEGTSDSKLESRWSEEGWCEDWVEFDGCTPIEENCRRTVARIKKEECLQSLLTRLDNNGYFSEKWECDRIGLVDLEVKNQALLNKWIWRYKKKRDSLWREVLVQKTSCDPNELLPNMMKKSGKITKFSSWEEGIWVWNVQIRRQLLDYEVEQWEQFEGSLKEFHLSKDFKDEMSLSCEDLAISFR